MKLLFNLITYSGILAAILLVITFIYGIAHLNYEVHEHLGVLTLIAGLTHGGLIGLRKYFINKKTKQRIDAQPPSKAA
jgi:uncharacterized membrane protein